MPKSGKVEKSASAEDPLSELLCFSLYSANHAMNRVYRPLLSDLGLTYPQYLVMVLLWAKDGQFVGDLGKALYLESNTLTPLIKRLETLGFVSRQRDAADERQVRVSLTRSGKALQKRAECIPQKIVEASGLTESALGALTNKILALRDSLIESVPTPEDPLRF